MTKEEYNAWSGVGGTIVNNITGLAPDYINAWIIVGHIAVSDDNDDDTFFSEDFLKPVRRYGDYITQAWREHGSAFFILQDSCPAPVTRINALVNEFNEVLPEIRRASDTAKIVEFYNRANKLIRGEAS